MLPALAVETPRSIAVDPPGGPLAIVVCEQLPRDAPGTSFDSRLYLERLRHHHGGSLLSQDALEETPTLSARTAVWGATVLYAEVITSTQTLLDRFAHAQHYPARPGGQTEGADLMAPPPPSGRGPTETWRSPANCHPASSASLHSKSLDEVRFGVAPSMRREQVDLFLILTNATPGVTVHRAGWECVGVVPGLPSVLRGAPASQRHDGRVSAVPHGARRRARGPHVASRLQCKACRGCCAACLGRF